MTICFWLDLIKEVLSLDDEIQKLATELYQQKSVLIMGRGYHYATCLEGALVSKSNLILASFIRSFFFPPFYVSLLMLLLIYEACVIWV